MHYQSGQELALVKLGLSFKHKRMLNEIAHGVMPGLAAGGLTYAMTDDPLTSAGVGLGAGGTGYALKKYRNAGRIRKAKDAFTAARNAGSQIRDISNAQDDLLRGLTKDYSDFEAIKVPTDADIRKIDNEQKRYRDQSESLDRIKRTYRELGINHKARGRGLKKEMLGIF